MQIRHRTRFWLIPLLLAWGFDLLFWKKPFGINFPIFVVLCLATGLYLVFAEDRRPARASFWLLLPILFFAGMRAVREEPMTSFVNVAATLGLLSVLAMTLLGGKWLRYSVSDYVAKSVVLWVNTCVNPLKFFFSKRETGSETAPSPKTAWKTYGLPALRGLLLAIPVLALLAALLASADPIFSDRLNQFLKWFDIENLGEYIFRGFYILILAGLLIGAILHALLNSQDEKLIGTEKPWLPPFIGWIESIIVLGSVDLLFAFFVAIQFRYFFGGQANIHIDGYTYADYARKGFTELVIVAVVSLLLLLALGALTRRIEGAQRRVFSGLGVGLVLLVIVILVSAFQRVLLYEAAYGFSRVRTYTNIFIIWLGLLLVATVILEVIERPRVFGLVALIAAMGYGVTADILNVDAFIARENIQRSSQGQELDGSYLSSLSSDVTPVLVQSFADPRLPASVKDQLGAALACRAYFGRDRNPAELPWMAFHYASYQATTNMQAIQPMLEPYKIDDTDGRSAAEVKVNGKVISCFAGMMD